jgi:glutamate--cysteine ligase
MVMNLNYVKHIIKTNFEAIREDLNSVCHCQDLPIYSSVDIRMNDFKTAVVDTNLFPAGFNNLCTYSQQDISRILAQTITTTVKNCKRILILAENHTRNKFYLENLYCLKTFIQKAGFSVDLSAIFSNITPAELTDGHLDLVTSSNKSLKVYSFEWLKNQHHLFDYDFVLLNNDLINGVPDVLRKLEIPTFPSYLAGWHTRNKSHHFKEVDRIMSLISTKYDIDPFFISTAFVELNNLEINSASDRNHLYDQAKQLFSQLESKYKLYNIDQKPFLFLKANRGTYGMGVTSIESPEEILEFNRKRRNNLAKGKESKIIDSYMLQEGVSSTLKINDQVAELCMYHSSDVYLGGFYRLNSIKNDRSNLNSQGMSFQQMNLGLSEADLKNSKSHDESAIISDLTFYKFLSLICVHAAQQEINQLELIHS